MEDSEQMNPGLWLWDHYQNSTGLWSFPTKTHIWYSSSNSRGTRVELNVIEHHQNYKWKQPATNDEHHTAALDRITNFLFQVFPPPSICSRYNNIVEFEPWWQPSVTPSNCSWSPSWIHSFQSPRMISFILSQVLVPQMYDHAWKVILDVRVWVSTPRTTWNMKCW